MTDANEICRMDTLTLARRIKAKELSPVEVVDAVLGRLERLDPVVHAFATVPADDARPVARRIEQDIPGSPRAAPPPGPQRRRRVGPYPGQLLRPGWGWAASGCLGRPRVRARNAGSLRAVPALRCSRAAGPARPGQRITLGLAAQFRGPGLRQVGRMNIGLLRWGAWPGRSRRSPPNLAVIISYSHR